MKKLLVILLILPFLLNAQEDISTEKYIRIVGVAERVLETDGVKLVFKISEIEGNEYKQIRPKSLEAVKSEFIMTLKSAGISTETLETDVMKNIQQSKYNNIKTENYTLNLKDKEEALKFSDLDVDGIKISSVTARFPESEDGIENVLSLEAIEDAKRKASNIAKSINREIGQILNISDMNNFTGGSRYSNSTNDTKTISYKVNVTFELN